MGSPGPRCHRGGTEWSVHWSRFIRLGRDCAGSRSSHSPPCLGGGSRRGSGAHLTHCWGSGETPWRESGEKEQAKSWSLEKQTSVEGEQAGTQDLGEKTDGQRKVFGGRVTGSELSYLRLVEKQNKKIS